MVYPALVPLMRTPRLPVVDWTDAPADLNALVRFAERRNLISARVPSHFKSSLPHIYEYDLQVTVLNRKKRNIKYRQPAALYALFGVGHYLTAELNGVAQLVLRVPLDIQYANYNLHFISIWTVGPQFNP